ncbi:ATP-binding protein [Litchfieldia salsa]|uniref:ATP-binding protein n=1 Tax=Litchfieldia salsa TaxID=930152 RepID=UPI002367F3A3|nr:ATP-binding protein [Litchfieldia salsa]
MIHNTKHNPSTCNMDVIYDCNVGSYLGIPIFLENGTIFGTICAIDPDPFLFTKDHVDKLQLFADMIVSLISKVENDSNNIQSQLKQFEALTAGISDKIGNSIQVIRGFLQLSLDNNSSYSNIILREVDNIRDVLKDFELTTKPPALIKREFSVDQLINNLFKEFEEECYLKNIMLVSMMEVTCNVHADYTQMKQVFKNLLRNAIDAIETNGKINVKVSSLVPHQLSITVTDNGHGIHPSIFEKIELPFFTTKENSIGLGLSITRRIINAHKGAMLIDSNCNGTCVLMEIPMNA